MNIKTIKAPSPGVFYRSPSPEDPCYKEEGDAIEVGDIIGLIEVMKSFIHIRSDYKGIVKSFLVDNEQTIMPGQDLMEVETD